MERYSENQERIMLAARELTLEQGYTAVSMAEVATRSGVGRATLYRHFASKEHLFAAVILQWGHQFLEQLEAKVIKSRSVGSRMSKSLALLVDESQKNPNLAAAQVASSASSDPNVLALHSEISKLMPGILNVATQGQRSKNHELACRTLEHMTLGNFILMNAGKLQAAEVAKEVSQVAEILLQDIWQKP